MKSIYLSTNGDTTTVLPYPIEVHEYGCGVIEMNGKILIPKENKKNAPKNPETQIPKPDTLLPDENGDGNGDGNPPNDELTTLLRTDTAPTTTIKKKRETTNNNDNLYLCCDIVEESFVGEIKMPVLRCIRRKNGFVNTDIHHVIWLSVMRPNISSIRLYICDDSGEIVSLPRNKLNCTLLFIPHKQ